MKFDRRNRRPEYYDEPPLTREELENIEEEEAEYREGLRRDKKMDKEKEGK